MQKFWKVFIINIKTELLSGQSSLESHFTLDGRIQSKKESQASFNPTPFSYNCENRDIPRVVGGNTKRKSKPTNQCHFHGSLPLFIVGGFYLLFSAQLFDSSSWDTSDFSESWIASWL